MSGNERPVTQRAVYSARPTIEIDRTPLERVALGLLALAVHESEDGLAALELRLANWASTPAGAERAFDAGSPVALGASVRVFVGPSREQRLVFAGRISALEAQVGQDAPPTIVVRAEDRLFAGRLQRRSRVYENMSLSELARQVASQLGLSIEADLPDATGIWAQFNESDLAFLRRVLARFDCGVRIDDETLVAARKVAAGGATVDLVLYSQLRRVRVVADLAHQSTRVTASGWDGTLGERFNVESTGSQLGAGSGSRGGDLLARHFGERSEHLAALACVDEREAQALAHAAFDQRARHFVTARGTAEGNPRLRAGGFVALSGLGARFDNTYEVAECVHRFDLTDGYQTDFVAHSAFVAAV
jgi:phage protein D